MSLKWWEKVYFNGGVTFTWDLLYSCNYRCSYCWFEQDKSWDELARKFPLVPYRRWVAAWTRVHRKYGRVQLQVLGGEPLVYPDVLPLLKELTRMHYVKVTTNLSPGMPFFEELAREVDKDALHLEASFHPQFARWEEFRDKLFFLKRQGLPVSAVFVAYPPQLHLWETVKDELQQSGINLGTIVFRGMYDGRSYPESYTPKERRILRFGVLEKQSAPDDEGRWAYQVERESTLGKVCYSGSVYANVKADGVARRCGGAAGNDVLGNVLDEDFALWDKPVPCPYKTCSCQEYMYLSEELEKHGVRVREGVAS